MDENLTLEQLKSTFRKAPMLLAKGITREDMAYIFDTALQNIDERILDIILDNPGMNGNEQRNLLHRRLSNDFIEIQYTVHNSKYYKLMKKNILCSLSSCCFKEQVIQCFIAYENKDYYPCVCGLLPIIERIMVDSKTSLKYNWDNIERDLRNIFKAYFNADINNNLEEYTIRLIVKMLASSINFNEDEPKELNRHWLLHGRADRVPNKADCLKLFNIIELIIDIKLRNNQSIS